MRLIEKAGRNGTLDDAASLYMPGINGASFWYPEFFAQPAWLEHAPFAFWIISTLRPGTFVELGTHGGYSYFAFCQAVKNLRLNTRCYAIDTWRGDEHAGFYSEEVFQSVHRHNEAHYSAFSRLVRATFDEALSCFSDQSVDLLHIDGRHFYEDVKHDFEVWRPKLSKRAVVLFHDTNVRERDFGVFRLWEELAAQYPAFEFLHGHGLGVLGYGAALSPEVKAFFKAAADPTTAAELRCAYSRLGSAVKADFDARQVQEQFSGRIAEQEAKTDAYAGEIQSRDAAAQEVAVRLTQREAEIEQMTARLAKVAAETQDLAAKLAARDAEMQDLVAQLAARDAEMQDLVAQLAARDAEMQDLAAQLATRDAGMQGLAAQLAARESALRQTLRSTSWRIGAPIRSIGRSFPRLRIVGRQFARMLWWSVTLRLYQELAPRIRARVHLSRGCRAVGKSGLFDSDWYLAAYPDVAEAASNPLVHYLLSGAAEGRNPNPLFHNDWYLAQNPDVAEAGINPLVHYIVSGAAEGRDPNPLFDSDWYLAQNPNVAEAGINPLLSYIVSGASQGRNPGPGFDSRAYLDAYPDVAAAGFNPLMHYLLYGQDEGRCLSVNGVSFMPARNDYERWIGCYDTLGKEERAALRAAVAAFASKPLISVVMPVYDPKPEWLIAAIESVRRQLYPHWELCIADDASTDAAIRPILERYAKADPRIRVVFRESNGHISAASNSALEFVAGEWVALLDHDDLLAEHALFWVAEAVNRHPEARLIYSDEDKIDAEGQRCDPYFKCDWNIDLFYSHNLISHLGVYRRALVRAIGGFREGLEGSQDHDLALRCIERLPPNAIHHIPRVLYHWRTHEDSTALASAAKPYAMLAGERALNEHFRRRGVDAHVELIGYGYRVHYALPKAPPRVSLIVPTRNGMPLIRQCVSSILDKTTYPDYEILIVDNGSDDPATLRYLEAIASDARVRVVRDERPFNFSALNNTAVQQAAGVLIGLINDDIEVIAPDWLGEMVSLALQPGIGAVGARLWYPNDTLQHGGVILGLGGVAGHSHKHLPRHQHGYCCRAALVQSFSAVTAACLVISKAIYEEVGGLNETDLAVAFNDVDFCLRVRAAGYRNVWTPYAELYHHESASRGDEDTPEKHARFAKEVAYMEKRWGHALLIDPAYSPNLAMNRDDFSFAWPPRVEPIALPVPDMPVICMEADAPSRAEYPAEERAGHAIGKDPRTRRPENDSASSLQRPAGIARAAAASQAAAGMGLQTR